jgi:hypothetical protein
MSSLEGEVEVEVEVDFGRLGGSSAWVSLAVAVHGSYVGTDCLPAMNAP